MNRRLAILESAWKLDVPFKGLLMKDWACKCACFVVGLLPAICVAAPDPARIEAGRAATAFVFVSQDKGSAMGSALCIDSSGIFVTNHHVVVEKGKPGRVAIVVSPGTRASKILAASILALDEIAIWRS